MAGRGIDAHVDGVACGDSLDARENCGLELRRLARKHPATTPRRSFDHSQETSSGTVWATALESRSTQSLVSRNVYFGTIGIQTWIPRRPVVFG